ncbi:MAG TPA: hypothetical protein VGH02_12045 [Rhizomicrobium sp.]|jgi:hypothetical protein
MYPAVSKPQDLESAFSGDAKIDIQFGIGIAGAAKIDKQPYCRKPPRLFRKTSEGGEGGVTYKV